jgi:uncharacterized protein YerC
MKDVIDIRPIRKRKDRLNKEYKKPMEEILCEWCNRKVIVEKSYGTWRNGVRLMPIHRFCCQDHHWKWHAKYGKKALGAKGENNYKYISVDLLKIETLLKQGKLHKEIAKELGVSKSLIERRIKNFDLKRFDENLIREEFVKSGVPFTNLAKKHGIGTARMKDILKCLNYRMNSKQGYTYKGVSDTKVKEIMRDKGYHVIECGNICLDKERTTLPLKICEECPIKNIGKLNVMSFFDMVLLNNNKFYLTEVKSKRDNFSWNQTKNLLMIQSLGINILIIKYHDNKVIEICEFVHSQMGFGVKSRIKM